jgi:pimeloyl-ACP methyl ester carboxylesterase
LLRFLDEQAAGPALVVGHSLGAVVAVRAALRHPERFAAIVLIDPVLFPPGRILQWNLIRLAGRMNSHPLIVAAQKRRQTFDDLDRLFNSYRQRAYFRYMSDDSLRDYTSSIACPAEDGTYATASTGRLASTPPASGAISTSGGGCRASAWRPSSFVAQKPTPSGRRRAAVCSEPILPSK